MRYVTDRKLAKQWKIQFDSCAALFLLTVLIMGVSTDANAIGYVSAELGKERPAFGPSLVYSNADKVLIADDVNRLILIYSDEQLNVLEQSINYPTGVRSINSIGYESGRLVVQTALGEEYDVTVPLGIVFESIQIHFSLKYAEADEEVIILKSGEELQTIIPSNAESKIVSWRLVKEKNNGIWVSVVEQAESEFNFLVYFVDESNIDLKAKVLASEYEYIPKNPILIDGDDQIYIVALNNNVWSHSIGLANAQSVSTERNQREFQAPAIVPADSALETVARKQRQRVLFNFTSNVELVEDYDIIDQAMIANATGIDYKMLKPEGLSRKEAISRALTYYTLPYFYRKRNVGDISEAWKSPPGLAGKAGSWLTGFKYYWSGYMSPVEHQVGLVEGHAVGDVDTSEIIEKGIVGCDCSGCVSSWLGIERLTTTGINEEIGTLFDEIEFSEMKAGDIFNHAGKHVRMLLNKIEGPNGTLYRIVESSIACQGVCIDIFTAHELIGYKALRYLKYTD